jgi:biopolymer transport protein ExbB/TolQ
MIFAFNEIATRGVVTPKELAEPIQKALVTTCFGLIVAIPNVVAFTFFTNHLHKLMAELGMTLDKLVLRSRVLSRAKEPPGSSGKGSKDAQDTSEAKQEK